MMENVHTHLILKLLCFGCHLQQIGALILHPEVSDKLREVYLGDVPCALNNT